MTNEELHEAITEMQAATKRGELPREVRLVKIEELTEAYFSATGEMPDGRALERLSDLCLYEELTDTDRMKVRNNEYPFLSETQMEERYKEEVSEKVAEEYGVDRRNYKPPVRRVRTKKDEKFIDKNAKIRNAERKRNYAEFTKVQPVIVSWIED